MFLENLDITNVGSIRNLSAEFSEKLTIITGETGSGKSMIVTSLQYILGQKANNTKIREGYDESNVSAQFLINDESTLEKIKELNIDYEDGLHISRLISKSSNNKIRINGALGNISLLKNILNEKIEIYGQNDSISLGDSKKQLDIIDKFSGIENSNYRKEYLELFCKFRNSKKEYSHLKKIIEKKIENFSYNRSVLNELKEAKLKINEDTELINKIKLYSTNESVRDTFNKVRDFVSDSEILLNFQSALNLINKSKLKDLELIENKIIQIITNINDISELLITKSSDLPINSENIDYLMQRQQVINQIQNKYLRNIEELINWQKELEDELNFTESDYKSELESKELEIKNIEKNLKSLAKKLSENRIKNSKIIQSAINGIIPDLDIKNFNFFVQIKDNIEDEKIKYLEDGKDLITFMVRYNSNSSLVPLSKAVSGGELSRLMLAFEIVFAEIEDSKIIVFDEIDTGIGGTVALKIGEKLAELSRKHQVLVISHLPQVASFADAHYKLSILQTKQSSETQIRKLDSNSKINEISRMLAGIENSINANLHAEELLKRAKEFKKLI